MKSSDYKDLGRHLKFIRSKKEEEVIEYFPEWLEEEQDFI